MKFLSNAILGQDILYYNVNIRYGEGQQDGIYTIASKQFNNENIILTKPCDYYLTISKMLVPLRGTPIFRCVPSNIGSDDLIYAVTIKAVDGFGLDATPQTVFLKMQTSLVNSPTTDIDYYSIFDYTRFIEMLNVALNDAWQDLSNLSVANQTLFGTVRAPFFYLNASTQLIEYYGEIGVDATPTEAVERKWELYFNKPLAIYFQGFQSRYNNDSEFLFQRVADVDYILYDTAGYTEFYNTVINGKTYFKFVSDYDILTNWNDIHSIQVFSNIPINREFVDDSFKPIGNKQVTQNEPTKFNLLLKELFVFTRDNNQLVRTFFEYQAEEFDFIDISKGCDALRNFRIDVKYVTKNGEKYNLRIPDGDSFLLKLMFIKKDYVINNFTN
jgi:hypothetical protein